MQLKNVKDPFGEINVYPEGDKLRVTATILLEPQKEGTQTGIAIDCSGSMKPAFGVDDKKATGGLFGGKKKPENQVQVWGRQVCSYLAEKLDADGGTTVIYWALPTKGKGIQVIGDLTASQAKAHDFEPPKVFGSETHLLPAVKYFVERFKDAPWGFYVFITDGELYDMEAVKNYTRDLSKEIASGKRHPLKFVLLGVGEGVKEAQMAELDDLDTEVDLWDHKVAKEMRVLQEIFAEVVDKNARIADKGRILDPDGKVIKDYSDTGMTAFLEFEVPAKCESFALEVNGNKVTQSLR